MVVEIMGHKVGWLGLYAGVAGHADVILLPEIPYDVKKIGKFLKAKKAKGQNYFIVACSEGALDLDEGKLGKKELKKALSGNTIVSYEEVSKFLDEKIDGEEKLVVSGATSLVDAVGKILSEKKKAKEMLF